MGIFLSLLLTVTACSVALYCCSPSFHILAPLFAADTILFYFYVPLAVFSLFFLFNFLAEPKVRALVFTVAGFISAFYVYVTYHILYTIFSFSEKNDVLFNKFGISVQHISTSYERLRHLVYINMHDDIRAPTELLGRFADASSDFLGASYLYGEWYYFAVIEELGEYEREFLLMQGLSANTSEKGSVFSSSWRELVNDFSLKEFVYGSAKEIKVSTVEMIEFWRHPSNWIDFSDGNDPAVWNEFVASAYLLLFVGGAFTLYSYYRRRNRAIRRFNQLHRIVPPNRRIKMAPHWYKHFKPWRYRLPLHISPELERLLASQDLESAPERDLPQDNTVGPPPPHSYWHKDGDQAPPRRNPDLPPDSDDEDYVPKPGSGKEEVEEEEEPLLVFPDESSDDELEVLNVSSSDDETPPFDGPNIGS